MNSSTQNQIDRELVEAPRKYICTVDDLTLKCVAYEDPETKRSTDKKLLKYCSKHAKTRVLVRYPRGHYFDDAFMLTFQKHARILFSETFDVSDSKLQRLLRKFYYNSSHLSSHKAIREKCDKVWDDCGKVTIFIFQLYDNCGCHPKKEDNGHLKLMKKEIRSHFGTMHCLHTSDDHEETLAFTNQLFR